MNNSIYFLQLVLCIYTGYDGDGYSCSNINECVVFGNESLPRHDCPSDAVCIDLAGNFTCECASGFLGTGWNCTGEPYYAKWSLNP